jgi:hypothetical protein
MNKTLNLAITLLNSEYKHVLEFGVYSGNTVTQLKNLLKNEYEIFGFDSFEGLPEDWVGTSLTKGFFNLKGQIPSIDGVTFFKGWFVDTILEYKKIAKPIALLHIDCDLYSSTIDVLYGLKEFIVPGTVIVFDEWYYNFNDVEENRQHEQKAFYEWVKDFNINYEEYPLIEQERKIIKIV